MNLITYKEVLLINPLLSDYNEDKIMKYIVDSQKLDIRPLLGTQLYLDLINNIDYNLSEPYSDSIVFTDSKYNDLMNGCEWTYNDKLDMHEGLKTVLVNYAYARYLPNSTSVNSESGEMELIRDFSRPLSSARMSEIVQQANSAAYVFWQSIERFLKQNRTIYTLYTCTPDSAEKSGIRISAIGGQENKYPYNNYPFELW